MILEKSTCPHCGAEPRGFLMRRIVLNEFYRESKGELRFSDAEQPIPHLAAPCDRNGDALPDKELCLHCSSCDKEWQTTFTGEP